MATAGASWPGRRRRSCRGGAAAVLLMVLSFRGQPASGSPDVSGVLYPMGAAAGVAAVAGVLLVVGGRGRRAFAAGLLAGVPVAAVLAALAFVAWVALA